MKLITLINIFGVALALPEGLALRSESSGGLGSTAEIRDGTARSLTTGIEVVSPGSPASVSGLDPLQRRATEDKLVLRASKRQNPGTFYECATGATQPAQSDCSAISASLVSTGDQPLIIAQYGCVVYSSGTCRAFFCSLCGTLETSTQFIVNQLAAINNICLAPSGQGGNIVSEGAGGWQAGFLPVSAPLPFYDICDV